MKIINKYIFRELITPFWLSLFILLFVLIIQFFIKNIDKFLGKGLSISIVLKYLLFNSASLFSIAVPMAALIATMMAFGRLSSDNEISALKSSGISYFDLLKPAVLFGTLLILFMVPFNLWILPEMNYNHKILTQEVSRQRPDVQIQEYQKNDLFGKVIYVEDENKGTFNNITIFDNNNVNNNTTIFAESGNFKSLNDGILFNLKNGSLHNFNQKTNEYQKTYFENYQISIPFDDINLNPNNRLLKNDREMNVHELLKKINLKKNQISLIDKIQSEDAEQLKLYKNKETNLQSMLDSISNIKQTESSNYNELYIDINKTKDIISNLSIKIGNNTHLKPQYLKEINRSYVEIHKKIALPFACLIFILLGIPLGIISKNSKFSINIALSLAFIIIYWAFIQTGEFLADEGKLDPFLSMWAANFFMGAVALYLFNISAKENFSFNFKLLSIKSLLQKNK